MHITEQVLKANLVLVFHQPKIVMINSIGGRQ